MASASLETSPQSATRVRYVVLGFGCTLSMITYLDRVCMASAAKPFVEELGLSSVADLKWVFAAFSLAYALFEVPSGWLGDVFGPRSVLIRIILWWSAFTALTGLVGLSVGGGMIGSFAVGRLIVTPLAMLIAVRFLFGIGEAGAYPNVTRALHNWFPVGERGFAQGAVWMCGRLMGGLTPLVWMGLMAGSSGSDSRRANRLTEARLQRCLVRWRRGAGPSGCLRPSAWSGASSSPSGFATGRKKSPASMRPSWN